MKIIRHICYSLLLAAVAGGCKKDETTPAPDVLYTVTIEDRTVTFTNETSGAVSYKWDFGDGETSTEESPVHTYPGKGKYVPTLYATNKDGAVAEGSTVIFIAKTSPVKLNDNSFADWDDVTQYVVTPPANDPYFKQIKVDYDAQYVYFYIEGSTQKANGDIFDFYLDTDNDPGTGYTTDVTGAGFDVLLEGTVFGNWLDAFTHKGAQNAFDWDLSSASEFYATGYNVESGGTFKFEMRISRGKLKGLAATTAFKFAIFTTKNDWSAGLGRVPSPGGAAIQVNFE
ncbi:PKD domain-containing protein [uncultured Chitinophaga sp.]|jgi:FOG: PKD repeat|uniref:PKD domain-containing protein n=1 Tax=uncultured Chitinophaga sp. TaxID=339340 RepID=UPI0026394FFC|nr:PKD domain-containing protein [uncultured Chitinophaga sp.]